jgi:hypothetical protein
MKPDCKTAIAGLLFLLLAPPMPSQAAQLSFRDEERLPALGVRLPMMAHAQAVPLPPVQTYDYTFTRGAETWKEQRYEPFALWYESQHVARWQDPDGNTLRLGILTAILPAAFEDKHVTREHYATIAAAAGSIGQMDAEAVHRWMIDFVGQRVGARVPLTLNSSRLASLYRFEAKDPRVHAYLFRFDQNRGGQAHLTNAWFGLVATTTGDDPARDRAIVERELLGKLGTTSRFDDAAEPRGPSRDGTPQVRAHPTRDAARRSVAHLADWWSLDSNDYIVLSNHRAAERFAQDVLDDLQAARSLYARLVPAFAESAADVSVVRIFATSGEYDAYVGPDHAWTAGIFDPSRRELVIRPAAGRGRDAQYERILRVALHEGFHQYLFHATGGLPTSAWFNEGHATFFEVARTSERNATVGENEGRVARLEQLVAAKATDLRSMLTMSYETFYGGSDEQREARYSLAWGLVYFLQRGAPLERNRPHAEVLARYMEALAKTGNPDSATAAAFDGIDLAKFERAFVDFWKTPRARAAARRAALP